MVLKLYALSYGPPSMSVRQLLAVLDIPYELINVDFLKGEHLTDEYAKMNPQKEIPVLDDDGFFLSESNAILKYLCDKYRPASTLYPTDPKARAIVNHRLFFHSASYDPSVQMYTMVPIFYDYERTRAALQRANLALSVLDTYLTRLGTKYMAGDNLTIADFPFLNTTATLEATGVDFSKHTKVQQWYDNFKKNHPDLWKIAAGCLEETKVLEANPPDMSQMNHPTQPIRKAKK